MNIIIVGATKVGLELAEYLVNAAHAVTLVDDPSAQLSLIASRLDLRVVQDNPSYPSTLKRAGAENAELLVATTDNDEVNITACCIAAFLFRVPRKIARIRARAYLEEAPEIFGQNAIPIDHIISPEQLCAQAIIDLLSFPGAGAVGHFADKRVVLIEVRCTNGGKLIGHKIEEILEYDEKVALIALYRNQTLVENFLNEYLAEDDVLYFACERSRAMSILTALVPVELSAKLITIAGGSHIADELAAQLSGRYQVKLIEPTRERALKSSDRLQDTKVEIFWANPANLDFLIEEHINTSDRFIAAAGSDETNIISSLMLKSINKVKTIAVVRDQTFNEIIKNSGRDIDFLVSPREAIISEFLSQIRQEGVEKVRIYRAGQVEGIELKVKGTKKSSHVVGRKVSDLILPKGVILAMAVRDKKVIKIDPQFLIEENDTIIALLTAKESMADVIKLFKPRSFWIVPWQ